MCPNCNRGLTESKEVCPVCSGTGFWNPQSLSVEETNIIIMSPDETPVITEETVAPEADSTVADQAPAVEEAAPAVEVAPTEEVAPEVAPIEEVPVEAAPEVAVE